MPQRRNCLAQSGAKESGEQTSALKPHREASPNRAGGGHFGWTRGDIQRLNPGVVLGQPLQGITETGPLITGSEATTTHPRSRQQGESQ